MVTKQDAGVISGNTRGDGSMGADKMSCGGLSGRLGQTGVMYKRAI